MASIAIKEISGVLERIGVLNRLAVDDPGTTGTLPEGPALTSARPGRTHSPSLNVVGNARCHRSGHRDTGAPPLLCLTARSVPGDR